MWMVYLIVGWLILVGLNWLIGTISELISTHSNNVDELNKIIENLSVPKSVNVKEVEQKLGRLKKASFLERPSKKKLKYCQKLLSPYVVDFIQHYSNKVNSLKELLERQDVPAAEKLLGEIQMEQSRAPEYCRQYDKIILSCKAELKKLKIIQAEFNNGIKRLQILIDNGTKNDAYDIVAKLRNLLACNPDYRKFDKQMLSQLENEVRIKWPKWNESDDFFDFL